MRIGIDIGILLASITFIMIYANKFAGVNNI